MQPKEYVEVVTCNGYIVDAATKLYAANDAYLIYEYLHSNLHMFKSRFTTLSDIINQGSDW